MVPRIKVSLGQHFSFSTPFYPSWFGTLRKKLHALCFSLFLNPSCYTLQKWMGFLFSQKLITRLLFTWEMWLVKQQRRTGKKGEKVTLFSCAQVSSRRDKNGCFFLLFSEESSNHSLFQKHLIPLAISSIFLSTICGQAIYENHFIISLVR